MPTGRKPKAAAKSTTKSTPTKTTSATAKKPAARTLTFVVLPHDGDPNLRWDLHQKGARKHEYFHAQKEAIDAAWTLAAGRKAHVVLHARDGHTYRELTK